MTISGIDKNLHLITSGSELDREAGQCKSVLWHNMDIPRRDPIDKSD